MPAQGDRKTPSVLVVEDDSDFSAFVLLLLEEVDAVVSHHADGIEGLNACLRDKPDLVILDLNLPSLRGQEILRLIRSSPDHQAVRIIICSEMPREQRREMELLSLGADAYIEKPFQEEAFLADVRRLLRPSSRRRPNALPSTPTPPRARHRAHWNLDSSAPASIGSLEGTQLDAGRDDAETPSELPSILDENLFPDYRLMSLIGGGNMGTVYRARQLSVDRDVALKVLLRGQSDTQDALDRFKRESLIMARLNHPNIVQVYEAGNTGFTFFIAMELMDAGALEDRIGEISHPESLDYIAQACDALAYLHDQNIFHRDIKPANLLVSSSGRLKLSDFGISRAQLPADGAEFTRVGSLMGTPLYMAPELMMGSKADARSDQYALGRTILRLFEGPDFKMPPPRLDHIRPDLPKAFRDAVHRCMSMDPDARFPSIREAKTAFLGT